MTSITPYLFFSGRCEEALEFYRQTLDAKIEMVMRFNESPDPVPEGMLEPGFENKIMHASFVVGETRIMASDGCDPTTPFQGFSLSVAVSSQEEAKKVFDALAQSGSVTMPLGATFWSPCFGMLVDQFKVAWMVNLDMPCPEA